MERDLIALVRDRLPHDGFIVGPGDDAAVFEASGRLAWSTDLALEGVHFDLSISSVADAAVKALNRNLSDLAAMGASPVAFLLAVGLPPSLVGEVEALATALAEVCADTGLRIAGGDLARSDTLLFSISILGSVEEPLERSGARAGDLVAVTGTLGEAGAGLAVEREPTLASFRDDFPNLLARHRRGCARLREGRALVGLAHAVIDVSDGLGIDLGRVALASGVQLEIDPDLLPRGPGVAEVEAALGRSFALGGGDDYELALTLPPDALDEARRRLAPTPLTVIGLVTEGAGVVDAQGRSLEEGHEHLV